MKTRKVSPPLGKSTAVRIGGKANEVIAAEVKRNKMTYKEVVETIVLQWKHNEDGHKVDLGSAMLAHCRAGKGVEDAALAAIKGEPVQPRKRAAKASNGVGKPKGAPAKKGGARNAQA